MKSKPNDTIMEYKKCLRQPIPEIYDAARLLDSAVTAHLMGNSKIANELILMADIPAIRDWTESIWGSGGIYSTLKQKLGKPETISKDERDTLRMPKKDGEKALLKRDGHNCRFCGIPVIRKEVRDYLKQLYPGALKWESKNIDQHAGFQAMWVQYDHVIPHGRGGKTTFENMVITCAPCNYGRMNFLIEEINIFLPELDSHKVSGWDGLERILLQS